MTRGPVVFDAVIDGLAYWSDRLPAWDVAAAVLRGERAMPADVAPRPSPSLLPAAERRRAPDTVALGLDVAARAVAASGRDPRSLPSVFASAHGDLGIADQICATLADDPSLVSPVKFHNSVHNAVSGYWGIATGAHAASTSVAAFGHTFALGLLEALTQLAATGAPVLLVGCDVQVTGPLAQLAASDGRLAVALVLAPPSLAAADGRPADAGPRRRLRAAVEAGPTLAAAGDPPRSDAGRALAGNALGDAVPLLERLAIVDAGVPPLPPVRLAVGPSTELRIVVLPHEEPSR